jgi:flavorubredoxin
VESDGPASASGVTMTIRSRTRRYGLSTDRTLDVVEIVPSRLYVLGGRLQLGPEISWAPESAWGRWQPMNSYLLREGEEALLVDPGLGCFADLIVQQLGSILPTGSTLGLYVTRPEMDTFGCLPNVAEHYEIGALYAGGSNPFDAFDYLTTAAPSRRAERIGLLRFAAGSDIPLGPDRGVTVLRPSIRVLITHWGYDAATETLFTSDAFGHGTTTDPADSRIMEGASDVDAATVRDHLLAKFWWLGHAGASAALVWSDFAALFDRYPISMIAPTRGRVIHGRDAVDAHYELIKGVFAEIERGAAPQRFTRGRAA